MADRLDDDALVCCGRVVERSDLDIDKIAVWHVECGMMKLELFWRRYLLAQRARQKAPSNTNHFLQTTNIRS